MRRSLVVVFIVIASTVSAQTTTESIETLIERADRLIISLQSSEASPPSSGAVAPAQEDAGNEPVSNSKVASVKSTLTPPGPAPGSLSEAPVPLLSCNLPFTEVTQKTDFLTQEVVKLYGQLDSLNAEYESLYDKLPVEPMPECPGSESRRIERLREDLLKVSTSELGDLDQELRFCIAYWDRDLKERYDIAQADPNSGNLLLKLSSARNILTATEIRFQEQSENLDFARRKINRLSQGTEILDENCGFDLDFETE